MMIYQVKSNFYYLRQQNMTNAQYLKRFNNQVDMALAFNDQLHGQAITDLVTEVEHPGVVYSAQN